MTNVTKMLLALLGGAVVGATAALLFAPKSGAELRAEIAAIAREKYKTSISMKSTSSWTK